MLSVGRIRVIPEKFLSEGECVLRSSLAVIDHQKKIGGFARVYLAKEVQSQKSVALKRIITANREHTEAAKREVVLMVRLCVARLRFQCGYSISYRMDSHTQQGQLRHKNIVQFYDAEMQPLTSSSTSLGAVELYIAMEYCPGKLREWTGARCRLNSLTSGFQGARWSDS